MYVHGWYVHIQCIIWHSLGIDPAIIDGKEKTLRYKYLTNCLTRYNAAVQLASVTQLLLKDLIIADHVLPVVFM